MPVASALNLRWNYFTDTVRYVLHIGGLMHIQTENSVPNRLPMRIVSSLSGCCAALSPTRSELSMPTWFTISASEKDFCCY